MDSTKFRAALTKLMPGYNWTVHRSAKGAVQIVATGIRSSGFNRLSTLEVTYSCREHGDWFTARSAGFGLRAPWLGENGDVTLARALRGLQELYRQKAAAYSGHESALAQGRKVQVP
ncbi:hypothetical protein PQ455_01635 [Sphingomonas naphthae]|uniref:Uncharacterized protein n=1 Tax=Sphingomonas naphthae TaxID=1813468 RepID=A0ABY7TMQ0_9SPHN|nr:hypothetical protein [Sphingomonas naphthae]WCT73962.1 hypothetical protein PQ455_01635 [Sphingomonas naphthae]